MNEILAIAECVKDGLGQFFSPDVTFEIKMDSKGVNGKPVLTCYRADRTPFLMLFFREEDVRINAISYQYCHPKFPNSMLHSISLICRRKENFERIKTESKEMAEYDPKGALAYFLGEMQADPLLGRFMTDNFGLVLPFMCSGNATSAKGVIEWIDGFALTPVECYEEVDCV